MERPVVVTSSSRSSGRDDALRAGVFLETAYIGRGTRWAPCGIGENAPDWNEVGAVFEDAFRDVAPASLVAEVPWTDAQRVRRDLVTFYRGQCGRARRIPHRFFRKVSLAVLCHSSMG